MLKFYRNKDNETHLTRWVEEKLDDMVVAHKLVDATKRSDLPNEIDPDDLPILSDGHESWSSEEEIREFLHQLDHDLSFSRSLTSDACYIDPENPDQCL